MLLKGVTWVLISARHFELEFSLQKVLRKRVKSQQQQVTISGRLSTDKKKTLTGIQHRPQPLSFYSTGQTLRNDLHFEKPTVFSGVSQYMRNARRQKFFAKIYEKDAVNIVSESNIFCSFGNPLLSCHSVNKIAPSNAPKPLLLLINNKNVAGSCGVPPVRPLAVSDLYPIIAQFTCIIFFEIIKHHLLFGK